MSQHELKKPSKPIFALSIGTALSPLPKVAGRTPNVAVRTVHTVCEGQYRTLSYVGDHDPVIVDEPLHLFGQDTAPAPGEIVLSGLGGCLAVGITAVATFKNVRLSRLELHVEGDVGNTAAWGAGGAPREPSQMGSRRSG